MLYWRIRMAHCYNHVTLLFAVCATLAFAGCDHSKSPPNVISEETEHHAGDGHAHGEAGHSHSTQGPHQGHLIELGLEEFHAELTHDDASQTTTIYLLDHAAKEPVAIPDAQIMLNLVIDGQPMQAALAATPQEGDPAGQSSRFSVMDEQILDALKGEKTTGEINVSIGGKEYSGKVEHHHHGEQEDIK